MEIKNTILDCLRETSGPALQVRLLELTEQEWSELLDTSNEMGLAQVIYSRLRRLGVAIPADVQTRMQASIHTNSATSLGILSGFHKIVSRFDAAKIPLILLKGVFLAEKLYGNFGERQITDIDILIHQQDIPATLELVEGLGYHTKAAFDLEYELKVSQHLPAFVMDGMPMLEVHLWLVDPMPHFHIDLDGLWKRAIRSSVGGKQVLVLCDEDLLMHLCAHAAYNHLFDNELRLLYDIKLLAEKSAASLDWPALVQRAQAWGIQKAVYLALRLTDNLVGCQVPDIVWQGLRPADFDERLIEACQGRVFSSFDVEGGLVIFWQQKGLGNRVKAAFQRVFLPPKLLARKYGLPPEAKWVVLYYPVRLFDLLLKFTGSLFGLVTGKGQKARAVSLDTALFDFLDYKQNR